MNKKCVVCGEVIKSIDEVRRINVKIDYDEKPVIGPVNGITVGKEKVPVCVKCGNLMAISYMISNTEHIPYKVGLEFEEVE